MIPKIVHYCWLSSESLPCQFEIFLKGWKEKMPDYKFILWNFDRFDINQSIWVKEAFAAKKYAFAADYIRLYALYNYGGIYLDLDVEVVRPLDDLLVRPFILGYESDNNAIEGGVMGGIQGDGWIYDCLNYYDSKKFVNPDGTFNDRPLPYILYSIISKKYVSFLPNILPFDYLTAKSLSTREVLKTVNTYTVHHFAGSWNSKFKRFKKRIKELIGKRGTLMIVNIKNYIIPK